MTLRRTFTTRSTKRTLTAFATRRSHGTHHGRSVVPGLGSCSSHNPSPANHNTLAKIKFINRKVFILIFILFSDRALFLCLAVLVRCELLVVVSSCLNRVASRQPLPPGGRGSWLPTRNRSNITYRYASNCFVTELFTPSSNVILHEKISMFICSSVRILQKKLTSSI